jgi:ribose transport system permease protein
MVENVSAPSGQSAQRAAQPSRVRRMFGVREIGVLVALLIMAVVLALTTPAFLNPRNLLNVGRQVSLLGIMAVGMTFVLIAREVDLSIGSTFAITGLVTGMLLLGGWGLPIALVAGLGTGIVVGLINGLLSTYGQLPSFITTLGMMSVVRGVALLITDGQPIALNTQSGLPPRTLETFLFLGQGRLFGIIPMQLVFFAVVALIGWLLLSRTVFGFRIYAVGGSDKAARASRSTISRCGLSRLWVFWRGWRAFLVLRSCPVRRQGARALGWNWTSLLRPLWAARLFRVVRVRFWAPSWVSSSLVCCATGWCCSASRPSGRRRPLGW